MNLIMLIKGVALGFSIAAPVGPIGVLCIDRTLTYGRRAGFCTGAGVALADVIYGCIAAFGLTAVSDLLMEHHFWIRLFGGLFLGYLGIKILVGNVASKSSAAKSSESGVGRYVSSGFLLTITNPMTILSFVAAFVALGLGTASESSFLDGSLMVVGVFAGSILWWALLSEIASRLKSKISANLFVWIKRGSGAMICLFALSNFYSIVHSWAF